MSDIVKKAKARDVTEVAIPCISSVFTSRDHEYEANGAEDGDHEGPGSPCPDGPGTRSEGGALEHNEASSSNDLASTISNKLEAPIRHPVVPVARSGIHNSVAVDPSVAEAQDRLNALLDNIDSKRKREEPSSAMAATVESPFDWVRYKDPQTTMDYYYNIRTGVTQWERPAAFTEASVASTAGSVSTGGYLYGVGGDQYVAQASFNKKAGSFGAAGATTYWEQMGRSNDRAGRQLAAFFDLNTYEQNRAEAALKKQRLQQSHVDWRQYKEEKKKKKEAQKKEWLLKDD